MKSFLDRLRECDELMRSAEVAKTRSIFAQIPTARLSRDEKLMAAQVARRIGLIGHGLRILQPRVRSEKASEVSSEGERAEYANLLCLNGNVQEALLLLGKPHQKEALLAKAWCLMEIWEFEAASELLRKFISLADDPYFKNAGLINLAEALIAIEQNQEGIELVSRAISDLKAHKHFRLLANGLHVRATGLAALSQISASNRDLMAAEKIFGLSPTRDAFSIKRQLAFNQAKKEGNPRELFRLRTDAKDRREWESLREIDFQILKLRFAPSVYAKLYFGSPYAVYRDRLTKHFRREPPKELVWTDRQKSRAPIDIGDLHLSTKLHSFMKLMFSDLYKPQSVGSLFAGVFPGEYFDWRQSPNKVHQLISRLRKQFSDNEIPLKIFHQNGDYAVRAEGPVSVRLSRDSDLSRSAIEQLRRHFLTQEFSAPEAQMFLGLSKTGTNRTLKSALVDKTLSTRGAARTTVYRFTN